jgi:hypothetical protein
MFFTKLGKKRLAKGGDDDLPESEGELSQRSA